MKRIYLASSWRNMAQPLVLTALRDAGNEVYDFRNPAPGNHGFHWSAIDPKWEHWSPSEYLEALEHPIAIAGFRSDFEAMQWADTGVLLLPSGRSAHLEAGYFVGAGKPLHILMFDRPGPDLMNRMATSISLDVEELLAALS